MRTPSYKLEKFSVLAEPLSDSVLECVASRVARDAWEVYQEDRGVYSNFWVFLGFRIGVESMQYVYLEGGRPDMERFATAVIKHAKSILAESRQVDLNELTSLCQEEDACQQSELLSGARN